MNSIGLNHVDPVIAGRIHAMLDVLRMMDFKDHQSQNSPERNVQIAARSVLQRKDKIPYIVRLASSIGLGFTTLLVAAPPINAGTLPGPFVLAAPAVGGLVYGLTWWVNKQQRVDDLDMAMTSEEVRAACSVINPTPSEASYMESIALLVEMRSQLDAQTGKDILTELNTMMAQCHQLDEYQKNLKAAINAESAEALIAQRDELQARLSRTSDEDARRAIEQSIGLLDSRCQVAQNLQPGLERVEAHQEVIRQTLASVQSTLARMKVAPAAFASPDLAVIQGSISEVTTQTRAVEDAVQEVMSLRV